MQDIEKTLNRALSFLIKIPFNVEEDTSPRQSITFNQENLVYYFITDSFCFNIKMGDKQIEVLEKICDQNQEEGKRRYTKYHTIYELSGKKANIRLTKKMGIEAIKTSNDYSEYDVYTLEFQDVEMTQSDELPEEIRTMILQAIDAKEVTKKKVK